MDQNAPAPTTGEPKPISRMNLEDLQSLATSLNIVVVDSHTKADLKERIVPLEASAFEAELSKPDAKLPLAISEEQYQWLVAADGNVSNYIKGTDGVWRLASVLIVEPVAPPVPPATDSAPAPAPTTGAEEQPPVIPTPEVEPVIEIAIGGDLPEPLDMPLADFIELISSGEQPVPPAITPEQRDWLKANTFFDDTLWNPDHEGIWRKLVVEMDEADRFALEDIDFELDAAQVKDAVQGWHLSDPIDGTVFAHSDDGWREAEVNSDGSASVTFLANVPRHQRSPGYRDSHDRTLNVASIDHLILTLVGLRTAAVETLDPE